METIEVAVTRQPGFGYGFEVATMPDNSSANGAFATVPIVSHVLEGGPAEGLLQPLDRVLACNGVSIPTGRIGRQQRGRRPDELLIRELLRSPPTAKLTIGRHWASQKTSASTRTLTARVQANFVAVQQPRRRRARSSGSLSMQLPAVTVSGFDGVSTSAVVSPERLARHLGSARELRIDIARSRSLEPAAIRTVRLRPGPDGGFGLRLAGGNASGIFVGDVAPGWPAHSAGIRTGDRLLEAGGVRLDGPSATKEAALLALMSGSGCSAVQVTTAADPVGYARLTSGETPGDLFHVRARFDLPPTCDGLEVRAGDILRIEDTLADGRLGAWLATRVHPLVAPMTPPAHGVVPSAARADQLAMLTGRRPPAYVRVTLGRFDAGPSPLLLLGPLAPLARPGLQARAALPNAEFRLVSETEASASTESLAESEAPPIVIYVGAGKKRPRRKEWRQLGRLNAVVSLGGGEVGGRQQPELDAARLVAGVLAAVRRCREEPVWLPATQLSVFDSCDSRGDQRRAVEQGLMQLFPSIGLDLPPAHFKEEAEARLRQCQLISPIENGDEAVLEDDEPSLDNLRQLLDGSLRGLVDGVEGGRLCCLATGAELEVPPGALPETAAIELILGSASPAHPLLLVGPSGLEFQRPVRLQNLPVAWSRRLRIFAVNPDDQVFKELAWASDLIEGQSETFSVSLDSF